MASSKELNTVWAKFDPVKSKVKEKRPNPVIEIKCSCRAEIVGNGFKIRRKGEQCNIKWHGTPKDPKPPKHKPIWFASEAELPAKAKGTIYCNTKWVNGCNDEFFADIHAKGGRHRKSGFGHYYGVETWMSLSDVQKQRNDYDKALKYWEQWYVPVIAVKPNDLKSQQAQPKIDAKPENLVWKGVVKGKQVTFTARDLYNFSIRRTIKRTKDRDWDLYKRQTEGVDILNDIATNAVVKFLQVNRKGTIKNPYTYLSRCIDTAITDYRKARIEQRLTVVTEDIIDYLYGKDDWVNHTDNDEFFPEDSHINDEPAVYLDYYEAVKSKPQVAVQVHTVQQLFKSKGLKLSPSKVRAVANALAGKNKGVYGNATTKRYIRSALKELKESEDETINAIYLSLTGKPLPRPEFKVIETLKATLDEDLEVEMPVKRWKTVNGERVYL